MRRILCVLLSILFLLSAFTILSGCQNKTSQEDDSDKSALFVGTWTTSVQDQSMTDSLMFYIRAALRTSDEEVMAYFDSISCNVTHVYTFREDGTYTRSTDANSVEIMKGYVRAEVIDCMRTLLKDGFKELNMQGSVDDLMLQHTGSTTEQFVDHLLEFFYLTVNPLPHAKFVGQYRADESHLYISGNPGQQPDETNYYTYQIQGYALLFEEHISNGQPVEDQNYPMVLIRKAT